LDPIERLFDIDSPGVKVMGLRWVFNENLPEEIRDAGFSLIKKIRFGRVLILHFCREVESVADMPADSLNSVQVDPNGSNSW